MKISEPDSDDEFCSTPELVGNPHNTNIQTYQMARWFFLPRMLDDKMLNHTLNTPPPNQNQSQADNLNDKCSKGNLQVHFPPLSSDEVLETF